MNPLRFFEKKTKQGDKLKLVSDGTWHGTEVVTSEGITVPGIRDIEIIITTGEITEVRLSIMDMEIDLDMELFEHNVEFLKKVYEDDDK